MHEHHHHHPSMPRTLTADVTPGWLQLNPGGDPQTVFVGIFLVNGKKVPAFSHDLAGPFVTDGLKWTHTDKYSLFIDYVLLDGVDYVFSADHSWYSQPVSRTQRCCWAPVGGDYSFTVFSDNERLDPRIIISPLGTDEQSAC